MNANKDHRTQLARLAAGELDEHEVQEVLDQVEKDEELSQELDALADVMAAVDRARASELATPVGRPRGARLPLWLGGLAAAGLVLFLAIDRRGPSRATDTAELIDHSIPPFTSTTQRSGNSGSVTGFKEAMSAYQGRDFQAVRESLTRFLDENPDHGPALFYRGVSHSQLGMLEQAVRDFDQAAKNSRGYLHEHSLWRLANVRLAQGEIGEAQAVLLELSAMGGEFSPNAVDRLEELAEQPR